MNPAMQIIGTTPHIRTEYVSQPEVTTEISWGIATCPNMIAKSRVPTAVSVTHAIKYARADRFLALTVGFCLSRKTAPIFSRMFFTSSVINRLLISFFVPFSLKTLVYRFSIAFTRAAVSSWLPIVFSGSCFGFCGASSDASAG